MLTKPMAANTAPPTIKRPGRKPVAGRSTGIGVVVGDGLVSVGVTSPTGVRVGVGVPASGRASLNGVRVGTGVSGATAGVTVSVTAAVGDENVRAVPVAGGAVGGCEGEDGTGATEGVSEGGGASPGALAGAEGEGVAVEGEPAVSVEDTSGELAGVDVAGGMVAVKEGADDTSVLAGSVEPVCAGVCVTPVEWGARVAGGVWVVCRGVLGREIGAVAEGKPEVATAARGGLVAPAGIAV